MSRRSTLWLLRGRGWCLVAILCATASPSAPADADTPQRIVEQTSMQVQPYPSYRVWPFDAGEQLLVGDSVGNLWHWRLDGPPRVERLHRGDQPWLALHVAPSGTLAVAIAADQRVLCVDLSTGDTRAVFVNPTQPYVLAVAPDESSVLINDGYELLLRSLEDGSVVRRFAGHRHGLFAARFSADGGRVVAGGHDHRIHMWDAATGEHLAALEGHEDNITDTWFADERRIISRSWGESEILLWDLDALLNEPDAAPLVRRFGPTDRRLTGGHASHAADRVVAVDEDGVMHVWQLSTGELLHQGNAHDGEVRHVRVLDDGRIRSIGEDDTVRTFDAGTFGETRRQHLVAHLNGITTLATVEDRLAVTGGSESFATVFDLERGHMLRRLAVDQGPIHTVAAVPGTVNVLLASHDGVRLVNADTGERHWHQPAHGRPQTVLAVDDEGIAFATAAGGPLSDDHVIRVHRVAEPDANVRQLRGHENEVTALAFHAPGSLASASRDGTLRVWEIDAEKLVERFEMDGEPTALELAFDGSRAVAGTEAGAIDVFDIDERRRLATFHAHDEAVMALTFIREEQVLLSAGRDGVIHAWETQTWRKLGSSPPHRRGIHALVPTAGDQWLAAGFDNAVRRWKLSVIHDAQR